MVKLRSTVSTSSTVPPEDPDPFATGLDAHRAETTANLKELQTSMLAAMRAHSDTMRSELMEELRQLRLTPQSPLRAQAPSFQPPINHGSPSIPGELDPVITQVLPFPSSSGYFPQSSVPQFPSSDSSVATTVDLSVLPLYSAYVTGGMLSHNSLIDNSVATVVASTNVPVCTVNSSIGHNVFNVGDDSRGIGQVGNQPGYYNPYWNFNPWLGYVNGNFGNGAGNNYVPVGHYQSLPQSLAQYPQKTHSAALNLQNNTSISSSASAIPSSPLNHTSPTPKSQNTTSIYSTTTTAYPQFHYANYPPLGPHPVHWNQHLHTSPYQSPNHQQSHMDPNLPTMKQMRLDFPIFSGDDPVDWLNKAEQFFQLYQIPVDRRITIAAMHLVENAANLWQLYLQDNPPSWNHDEVI